MNKVAKIILIYTAMIILTASGLGLYSYLNSYQYLIIQAPEDRQEFISLYKASSGDGMYIKDSDEKIDIEFNTETKLDRGLYLAEYSQEGFETARRDINLEKEIVNISFEYNLSKPALETIMDASKDNIYLAMEQSYPGILSRYTIQKESIHADGNWYGAVLRSNDQESLQRDTVRIVMKNDISSWKVAAKPYITISKSEYPQIPRDLLEELNKIPK